MTPGPGVWLALPPERRAAMVTLLAMLAARAAGGGDEPGQVPAGRAIARAAALSALRGAGSVRLGAELGVPAATVRGWLRRLRAGAGRMLQEASAEFGRLVAVIETPEGRDPCPPGPTGSVLGDALALVVACAVAAVRWHGRAEAELEALIGRFGLAALAPAPGS